VKPSRKYHMGCIVFTREGGRERERERERERMETNMELV
jgi:hypothetical protein